MDLEKLSQDDILALVNRGGSFAACNGMRIIKITNEMVCGQLEAESHHANPNGIVHGGVYVTMMDEVSGTLATIIARQEVKTISCDVRFMNVGIVGRTLYSFARPLRVGHNIAFIEAWVEDDQKNRICEGSFTFRV